MSKLDDQIAAGAAEAMQKTTGKTLSELRTTQGRAFAASQITQREGQQRLRSESAPTRKVERQIYEPAPFSITNPDPIRNPPGTPVGPDGGGGSTKQVTIIDNGVTNDYFIVATPV